MRHRRQPSRSITVLVLGAATLFGPWTAQADSARIDARATQRLQVTEACGYRTDWTDLGSGADQDLAIHRPEPADGYFIIGGHAVASHDTGDLPCFVTVGPHPDNVDGGRLLLAPPADWQLAWTDKGSGAEQDGSIWRAVAPPGFACLGDIGQTSYDKPRPANYRCINSCLVEQVDAAEVIWTDRGSGAERDISLYRLANARSFISQAGYASAAAAHDLKPGFACPPTAAEKTVAARLLGIGSATSADVAAATKPPSSGPPPPAAEAPEKAPPAARRQAILLARAEARRAAHAKPVGRTRPKPTAAAAPASDDLLRAIQVELNRLGYGTGTPDGRTGPRTRQAITAFQRDQGLPANSLATLALRDRLAAMQARPKPPVGLPKPAAPLPVPVPVKVKVWPGKPVFSPTEAVTIGYAGLPGKGQDWLAIASPDHAPDQYFDFVMLEGRPKQGRHVFKLLPPGRYQVRVYADWPEAGYAIAAKVDVTVGDVPTPKP